MDANTTTLDVREDIRAGREPLTKIMAAVAGLAPEGSLLIIAPFKPEPLFQMLATRGFAHEVERAVTGEWRVLFTRSGAASATGASSPATQPLGVGYPAEPTELVELDARGLEPPQPMVRILEAVSNLPAGAILQARTDRRPMHLYAQIESRGLVGVSTEQSDGSFITHIRHR